MSDTTARNQPERAASEPSPGAQRKLDEARNLWVATVRPAGRPHLVPVWFVWHASRLYLAIEPGSVKAKNLQANPMIAVALEDGSSPVICEGSARILSRTPEGVARAFQEKYDWAIAEETQYTALVEITPARWLGW